MTSFAQYYTTPSATGVTFTPIPGVTTYNFIVIGAGGGGYDNVGGRGAFITATYNNVTMPLTITVGGGGGNAGSGLASGGGGLSQVCSNDYTSGAANQTVNIIAGGGGGSTTGNDGGDAGVGSALLGIPGSNGNGDTSRSGRGGGCSLPGGPPGLPTGSYSGGFISSGSSYGMGGGWNGMNQGDGNAGGDGSDNGFYGQDGGGGGAASLNGVTGNGGWYVPGGTAGINGGGGRGTSGNGGGGGGGGGAGFTGGGGGGSGGFGYSSGGAGGGGSSVAFGTGLVSAVYAPGGVSMPSGDGTNSYYGEGAGVYAKPQQFQNGYVQINWTTVPNTPDDFADAIALWFAPFVNGGTPQDVPGSAAYNKYGAIGSWNTTNVKNMSGAFSTLKNPQAALFNIDISGWDTSGVTDMSNMFNGATAFNQNISVWNFQSLNPANAATIANCFTKSGIVINGAGDAVNNNLIVNALFNNANKFNAVQTFAMGLNGLPVPALFVNGGNGTLDDWFQADADAYPPVNGVKAPPQDVVGSYEYNTYGLISQWNTVGIQDMSGAFSRNPNGALFNQDISGWTTIDVTDMSSMFAGAAAFNQDISKWNTSNVTNMSGMFAGAAAFTGSLAGWNTTLVKNMSYMFQGATVFNQSLSTFNTSAVTDMSNMFSGATAFTQSLSTFNTSAVTDMSYMFTRATAFNQSLSTFNTSAVTDMSYMFQGATAFTGSLAGWDTSAVLNMNGMFQGATAFNQDLSSWKPNAVIRMFNMFNGATAFDSPLFNIDSTCAVIYMTSMFQGAAAFNRDISGWTMNSVQSVANMFQGAQLFSQDLSAWNLSALVQNDPYNVNITQLFTGSGIVNPINSAVNNKIYNSWLGAPNSFTVAQLVAMGLNTPQTTLGQVIPTEIFYSFVDGKFQMRDQYGNVIDVPIKLSLNLDFKISL